MSGSSAGPPRVKPRQSLSGRLWLLATLAVLLSEVVVFLPYIAHERRTWLLGHLEDATIAVLAAGGDQIDHGRTGELLRLGNVQAIRLTDRAGKAIVVGDMSANPWATIDLRDEGLLTSIRRALGSLILGEDHVISVTAQNPYERTTAVTVQLNERLLGRSLRRFAGDFAGLALLIAGVTGGLVYFAVLLLLVRPMRRLTGSIAAFRDDPERTAPLDPDDVSVLPDDEMAVAGRELAAMQHELRGALWRNARLAALGTVVAKVSHDLRGILTPALLTAERLQLSDDAKVQRAGETLANAVDRATDLVRRTLDYAREGPPPLSLGPVELAPLLDEAADSIRPVARGFRVENTLDASILVNADRNHLFRVFINLMRNAAEAGARSVRCSAEPKQPALVLDITDNGPGLPGPVQAELFRPFAGNTRRSGAGLGLAIARDLMVAHGGTIELVETSSAGTTFRLTLRLALMPAPEPSAARIAPAAAADV